MDFETTLIKDEFEDKETLDAVIKELQDFEDAKKGIKRRASDAFSDDGDVEFQGFVGIKQDDVIVEYNQVLGEIIVSILKLLRSKTIWCLCKVWLWIGWTAPCDTDFYLLAPICPPLCYDHAKATACIMEPRDQLDCNPLQNLLIIKLEICNIGYLFAF